MVFSVQKTDFSFNSHAHAGVPFTHDLGLFPDLRTALEFLPVRWLRDGPKCERPVSTEILLNGSRPLPKPVIIDLPLYLQTHVQAGVTE